MFVRILYSTVVRRTIDGAIVINTNSGEHCNINETGFFFMKSLDGSKQEISSLVPGLVSQFNGVSELELLNDLTNFFKTMNDKGFVVVYDRSEHNGDQLLRFLHLEITMKCNERCIHCYLPNKIKDEAVQMPYQHFCRLVDDFVALGGEEITLSGGEPLLHDSICSMLLYCGQKGLTLNLFSNLTLLNDEVLKALKGIRVGIIQTSIYSLNPDIHDNITKCKGTLNKTLAAIDKLISNGIRVQIATPVMSQNMDTASELMHYAKRKAIKLRLNTRIIPQIDGNNTFSSSYGLTLRQKKCFERNLLKLDTNYAINEILELRKCSHDICANPSAFLNSNVCSAGQNHCLITPSGDVYPCPMWQSYYLGNVFRETLSNIWKNNPLLKKINEINKQKNFKECLECELIDYCKRCLAKNDLINKGNILKIIPEDCKEASALKHIVESYIKKKKID